MSNEPSSNPVASSSVSRRAISLPPVATMGPDSSNPGSPVPSKELDVLGDENPNIDVDPVVPEPPKSVAREEPGQDFHIRRPSPLPIPSAGSRASSSAICSPAPILSDSFSMHLNLLPEPPAWIPQDLDLWDDPRWAAALAHQAAYHAINDMAQPMAPDVADTLPLVANDLNHILYAATHNWMSDATLQQVQNDWVLSGLRCTCDFPESTYAKLFRTTVLDYLEEGNIPIHLLPHSITELSAGLLLVDDEDPVNTHAKGPWRALPPRQPDYGDAHHSLHVQRNHLQNIYHRPDILSSNGQLIPCGPGCAFERFSTPSSLCGFSTSPSDPSPTTMAILHAGPNSIALMVLEFTSCSFEIHHTWLTSRIFLRDIKRRESHGSRLWWFLRLPIWPTWLLPLVVNANQLVFLAPQVLNLANMHRLANILEQVERLQTRTTTHSILLVDELEKLQGLKQKWFELYIKLGSLASGLPILTLIPYEFFMATIRPALRFLNQDNLLYHMQHAYHYWGLEARGVPTPLRRSRLQIFLSRQARLDPAPFSGPANAKPSKRKAQAALHCLRKTRARKSTAVCKSSHAKKGGHKACKNKGSGSKSVAFDDDIVEEVVDKEENSVEEEEEGDIDQTEEPGSTRLTRSQTSTAPGKSKALPKSSKSLTTPKTAVPKAKPKTPAAKKIAIAESEESEEEESDDELAVSVALSADESDGSSNSGTDDSAESDEEVAVEPPTKKPASKAKPISKVPAPKKVVLKAVKTSTAKSSKIKASNKPSGKSKAPGFLAPPVDSTSDEDAKSGEIEEESEDVDPPQAMGKSDASDSPMPEAKRHHKQRKVSPLESSPTPSLHQLPAAKSSHRSDRYTPESQCLVDEAKAKKEKKRLAQQRKQLAAAAETMPPTLSAARMMAEMDAEEEAANRCSQ
ncbi:hypothetical protein C8J56DRAFT_880142 [Mycena floridula]|nr:hypothetical protein C8J56DRAFT_880142 [Mycena floridula]